MSYNILIADDELDIVKMLAGFFSGKGYNVLTAANGIDTIKQAERKPDIILLDINMPGLDGLSVCERIRNYVSCPILFLTARIEDADKVKGFSVGGDDYIVKPFSLVELDARIKAHLRREARHSFNAQIKFADELTIDYAERCIFFKQKTAYEIPKRDWSSDVCSSDLCISGNACDRCSRSYRIRKGNSEG